MCRGHSTNLGARPFAFIRELEKLPDLIDRSPQEASEFSGRGREPPGECPPQETATTQPYSVVHVRGVQALCLPIRRRSACFARRSGIPARRHASQ